MYEISNTMSFAIIDDKESYRTEILNLLRKLGYKEIQTYATSQRALKNLKLFPANFIICDRNMPGIDGCQILKEVRESFDVLETVFLMIGSGAKLTKEDILMLSEYEVDGFLTKPFSIKNLGEKISQCVAHFQNPSNIESTIAVCKKKMLNNQFEDAIFIFEKLLADHPQSARVRVGLSRCHRLLNNFEKAEKYCLEALEKNKLYAQTYDELGTVYLAQNKVEDAMNYFRAGVTLSPKYAPRYDNAISAMLQYKKYKEVEEIFALAIENKIEFDEFDKKYGELLFHLRKFDKALPYLQKAHFANNEDGSVLNLIGICYKDKGKKEEALRYYNSALKLLPSDTRIMFNKALCLISLVRLEQATKVLNAILEIEPENKKVKDKLENLTKEKISEEKS